jgi:predicted RNase H-like HicB family nuclease
MTYRIMIEKGEDFGYISHCPAIPGCHSQGETLEEAIKNIKDAIRGCLEALDKDLIPAMHNEEELYMEVAI